ncbi:hypothetical protein M406DRAFT_328360 [Cryphonectria parasitica EP155]|uniref:Rad60/SUMO-like domain-containing protein n=1 Tax=Cryphonectria parasitica (strain ATCC 38755 / EP155) TaxID=660469 RepID=A0A9P5CRN0_CRYP1|nr:uncharacterized protein M406DRAFT_328360 [Cryphonectria parasitica EP155]KAF3767270.1 hypothetical protein M406DRAFT_328360 [Cryphonectria parasitica EP155]
MADTSSHSPGKGPNKKKPLPFLKTISKSFQGQDDVEEEGRDEQKEKKKRKDKDQSDDDALAMFRRSKSFFPVILQEQEERRKAALQVNREGKIHGIDEDEEEEPILSTSRSVKRRRRSSPHEPERPAFQESYDDLYGPATPPQRRSSASPTGSSLGIGFNHTMYMPRLRQEPPAPLSSDDTEKEHETTRNEQGDTLLTPSGSNSHQVLADDAIALDDTFASNTSTGKDEEGKPTPIVLDDSDDDLNEPAPAPAHAEDEFDFFVKRAAMREEKARLAAEALTSLEGEGFDSPATDDTGFEPKGRKALIPVRIFIVSRLGDIEVRDIFGSKRGLHQDLGLVRRTYVQWVQRDRPEITDDMARGIFLTWKGRRIYDSASGASLGWMPDSQGSFFSTAHLPGFTRGGILLEAWTEDSYAQYTEEQDRQKLVDRGELADDSSAADDNDQAAAQEGAAKVRLFLKERNKEPLRLTAWLDTEARTLVGAYRKQREIPEDREIRLRNDGEWLEPHTTMEEADIEDMMTIEVYLK